MKKLALALLGVVAAASTASASLDTGFYIGAGVGGNSLNYNSNVTGGVTRADIGRHRFEGSLYTGYGYVQGCTYVGGELGFTFTGGKAAESFTNLQTARGLVTGTVGIERRNVINAAILLGQKFSPSTMFYVRLGMNSNQYKITNSGTVNGVAANASQKKRKLSFAPGVGLEGAVTKNVRVRMQYVYDIGNTVPGIDSKVKTQTVTLGVAYKF